MAAWKVVHHTCGYQLHAEVVRRFEEGEVLVSYRDPGPCGVGLFGGVVVSMCPKCYGALRLWWVDPQRAVPGDG